MVFRQGSWLVAIGLGIGLALAIGAGRVLSVFFYGLPAAHLPTLLGTAALFLAIGAAASLVPARQAVGEGLAALAPGGLARRRFAMMRRCPQRLSLSPY